MSKLNEYPSVNNTEEFTPEQKAAFLGSANVISTGIKGGSTVTANIPFTEIAVANPVPTPDAAHADVGKVLTVQQASDPNDPDEIVWAAGNLPSYTQSDAGRVLTVNQAGNGVEWTTPQGGVDFSDIMSWSNIRGETVAQYIIANDGSGGGDVRYELWKSSKSNIWKLTPYVECGYGNNCYGAPIGSGEMPQ